MRKASIIIFFISFFSGCKKDAPPTPIVHPDPNTLPAEIEGLELTYLKTYFPFRLKSIQFINETTGYVAGYDGAMYKTTDGGLSWTALNTQTNLTICDIYFFNSNEGFAVGGGHIIIYTNDGGQKWEKATVSNAEQIELNSICFANDSLGFAVGGGTILKTKDRGRTWKGTRLEKLGGLLMDVEFIDSRKGIIACTSGKLIETADGGMNWTISDPFYMRGIRSLSLLNEHSIFCADYNIISKSTDFGKSWSNLWGYKGEVYALVFKSEKVGYALGRGQYSGGDFGHNYGAMNYTTDGGITWKGNDKLKKIGVIESASFPTANTGFAISGSIVIKITKK